MGRAVDRIDQAIRKMVVKEADERPGADPDHQDPYRCRLDEKGGGHVAGVREDQLMGAAERHPALQVAGAEIERAVITVIEDFYQMTVPVVAVDHQAWRIGHSGICRVPVGDGELKKYKESFMLR